MTLIFKEMTTITKENCNIDDVNARKLAGVVSDSLECTPGEGIKLKEKMGSILRLRNCSGCCSNPTSVCFLRGLSRPYQSVRELTYKRLCSIYLRSLFLILASLSEAHFNVCHFSPPKLKKKNLNDACNEEMSSRRKVREAFERQRRKMRESEKSPEAMVNTRGS
ncbi:hypothetical protein VNO77_23487 [Canavalia gladiata]|uniref:Uncharacterized protein n=1 Tax=Canavalia gladiata TaxID=3824 RepID=A0AAN9QBW7_CANGL